MTRKEIKQAFDHATAFYDKGGVACEYKKRYIAHWRTLAQEGLLDRIFLKRARSRRPKPFALVPDTPTFPQQWTTPLLDLIKKRY